MAQKIIPRSREPIVISSDFTGKKPTLFFQLPIFEFDSFEPAPNDRGSPRQVTLRGEDKTTLIGRKRLGNKKRAAADPQLATNTRKRLSIHSNNLIERADSYLRLRQYQNALSFYDSIISKNDPNNLQIALYRKSKCCWMLGHLNDARNCLDHLLELYPNDAEAWARRGAILIQQHEYPEALDNLKRSFVLSKASPFFVEYTILFDCYDSFANATDAPAFQQVSDDLQGTPRVSEDDLHLLRGIFFASRQNYTSALEELSIPAQKPFNRLAAQTLEVVQNIYARRGHIAREQPKGATSQAKRISISALLNGNDIDPPRADF